MRRQVIGHGQTAFRSLSASCLGDRGHLTASRPSDTEIAIGKPLGGLLQISHHSGVKRHAHGDASNAGLLWPRFESGQRGR